MGHVFSLGLGLNLIIHLVSPGKKIDPARAGGEPVRLPMLEVIRLLIKLI
jgi:hypothetical protein